MACCYYCKMGVLSLPEHQFYIHFDERISSMTHTNIKRFDSKSHLAMMHITSRLESSFTAANIKILVSGCK